MKKLHFILFFGVLINSYGQYFEDFDKSHNYQFTVPTFVKNYEDNKDILMPEKTRFTVIGDSGSDNVLILIGLFKPTEIEFEKYNVKSLPNGSDKLDVTPENRKLFILPKKYLVSNAINYYQKGTKNWTAGLVVLPVKLRSSPKSLRTFSKDLSLGFSGGYKMRVSDFNPTYLNFLVNIGISSITIDANSTNGKLTNNSERAAMTGAFGVVLENHAFQFGLFLGKDRLTAQDQKETDWQYAKKPWLALGLGYSILSKSDKSKNQEPASN